MLTRILLDPQGGDGNGGNNGNSQGNGQTGKADLSTVANGLLVKQGGDPIKVISRLLRENYGYRDENRDLKGKLPAEGSTVLSGDDAKLFDSYKAMLGPDPRAVKAALDAGTAAATRLGEIERDAVYAKAAKASSYNEPLFKRLAAQDKLTVAVEEVNDRAGKKVDQAFVVDDKGAKTPLDDYAKANWGELLPSLGGSPETVRRAGNSLRADDNQPPPNPGDRGQADVIKAIAPSGRYTI